MAPTTSNPISTMSSAYSVVPSPACLRERRGCARMSFTFNTTHPPGSKMVLPVPNRYTTLFCAIQGVKKISNTNGQLSFFFGWPHCAEGIIKKNVVDNFQTAGQKKRHADQRRAREEKSRK